jgi:hypothetical protein
MPPCPASILVSKNSNVLFVFKVRSLATHLAIPLVSHAVRLKYTYWDRLEALHYHGEYDFM